MNLLPSFLFISCVIAQTEFLLETFFPFSDFVEASSLSVEDAKLACVKHVSCAGITFIHDASTNGTFLYAHNFLPQGVSTEETYHSSRDFTIHSGLVHRGDVLETGYEGMTVTAAKSYCQLHPKCVAFSYPVHTMNLTAPDSIKFVSSVNGFIDDGLGKWRTYISNDLNKAKYVNATSIEFNDDPYPVCCEEKEVPTIEEIEAVDTLERISCDISREEFYEKYEKTRTPVMLVGCDENWKAKELWTIDKLIARFSNQSKWRGVIEDDPDNSRDFVTWGEIVDRRASNKQFYVFDNEFQSREENKQLEEDYEYPGPFQDADIYGHLKDYRSIDSWFRWFLMAPRDSGSFPHVDPGATDAWNSLVQGHKWWVLYPDADFENSYELKCDNHCSTSTDSERAWFTSVGINALRNECSNGKFPQHVLQKPGETIYVPYPLYHAVFNMDDTTCVTANFGSPGNLYAVWHEIVMDGGNHYKRAYYEILNKEQRKQIRDWGLWPIENINMEKYKKDQSRLIAPDDDDDDDEEIHIEYVDGYGYIDKDGNKIDLDNDEYELIYVDEYEYIDEDDIGTYNEPGLDSWF